MIGVRPEELRSSASGIAVFFFCINCAGVDLSLAADETVVYSAIHPSGLGLPGVVPKYSSRWLLQGGGGEAVKRKMKKCGKVWKKCGKMRRKKAMTRTELPVALHVVFQQHSFPVTRILVPGPKHTDGKFVF